jgi:L-xylulokinase
MTDLLVGVDAGNTVVKAAVFDRQGRLLDCQSVRLPASTPASRHVERDVEGLRAGVAEVLRAVTAGRADRVAAIGVTGHGDGLYLLDEQARPTRPGVLSLDSRAHQVVARWRRDGTAAALYELTGQEPWAPSPAALLGWFAEHEPDVLQRTRWIVGCKDTVTSWLTGVVCTDLTEASTSFADPATQAYSRPAAERVGLGALFDRLAPIRGCTEVIGEVRSEAAAATGLPAGVAVVAGLHDVDASAIGTGVHRPGELSVVAGSYSINQVISDSPEPSSRWCSRNFVERGRWMNMALSPASAANMEWFAQTLCAAELAELDDPAELFARLGGEASAALDTESNVLYLPFLYGAPSGAAASAAFAGLRGWHTRGHLVRAVCEGVVHTHRWHVDDLRERFTFSAARLTGGAARSPVWTQLFADGLGLPITTTAQDEAGALGAAMCAGIGAGWYPDLAAATAAAVHDASTTHPTTKGADRMNQAYRRFRALSTAMESCLDGHGG